jgi:hypothetical protein
MKTNHKKSDRIKFNKGVKAVIEGMGGKQSEGKFNGDADIFTINTKKSVLTIHLNSEEEHKVVYSVYAKYADLKKHNFHVIQRKGESVDTVIDLFKDFLDDAVCEIV